jgi:hypothetical protein
MDEKELKNKLEKDGEKKAKELIKQDTNPTKIDDNLKKAFDIVKAGADEFKDKTGRPMTYSEMRELYG